MKNRITDVEPTSVAPAGSNAVLPSVPKHPRHDHFWIEDGELYESYETIRGLRYMHKFHVNLPDCDKCSNEMMKFIAAEYL